MRKYLGIFVALALVFVGLAFVQPSMAIDGYNSSLTLENKSGDPDWNVMSGDGISAILDYNSSGATFTFSLSGKVPSADTQYSLIYYADPWEGDNPGALLGESLSDGDGIIAFSSNLDLGIDLPTPPDSNICGNYCTKMCGAHLCNTTALVCSGAKIWLIPSAYYDANTKMVTAWNPDVVSSILFETDLIVYDDTDIANEDVNMCANILEPQICVTVAPNALNFGSLYPGECNDTLDGVPSSLVVTNCGGIDITVMASASGDLFDGNLWLSHGIGWILSDDWTCDIGAWESKTINVRLCIPVGYQSGTATGSLSFVAEAQD